MSRIFKKNIASFFIVVLISLVFLATKAGITGTTKLSGGSGCSCHGAQDPSVVVTISGPDSLIVSQTGVYTVTMTGGPLVTGGINIAASAGVLTAAGSGLQRIGTELTQTSPNKTPVAGAITYTFTYTAPSTIGANTLYATGISTDGNSSADAADLWNFSNDFTVNVKANTDTSTENAFSVSYPSTSTTPNPVSGAGASGVNVGAEATGANLVLTTGATSQIVANAAGLRWPITGVYNTDTSKWYIEIPIVPVSSTIAIKTVTFGIQKVTSAGQSLQACSYISTNNKASWSTGGVFVSAGGSTVTSISNSWTTGNTSSADTIFLRIYFQTGSSSLTATPNTGYVTNLTVTGTAKASAPLAVKNVGNKAGNYSLEQNYPNPFNPSTVINYSIPAQSKVTLEIFDVAGHKVQTLVDQEKSAGVHSAQFNAVNLPSGIYLYKLQAGKFTQTRKLLLLK